MVHCCAYSHKPVLHCFCYLLKNKLWLPGWSWHTLEHHSRSFAIFCWHDWRCLGRFDFMFAVNCCFWPWYSLQFNFMLPSFSCNKLEFVSIWNAIFLQSFTQARARGNTIDFFPHNPVMQIIEEIILHNWQCHCFIWHNDWKQSKIVFSSTHSLTWKDRKNVEVGGEEKARKYIQLRKETERKDPAYTESEASCTKNERHGDTAHACKSEQQVDNLKAIKLGMIAYL